MAVNPPVAVTPSPSPAIDGAGVAYALAEHTSTNVPALVDVETWFDETSLRNLYGRMIAGVGLSFVVRSAEGAGVPAFPGFYGPNSLVETAFDICNVQILVGSTVQQDLPASDFRDTRFVQRLLEMLIRPPDPSHNDGLRFRVYSRVSMPYSEELTGGFYYLTPIIKGVFPPNGSQPGGWLPPQGLGLVSFGRG